MKRAVILGISSSLGQAVAKKLLSEGFEIIGTKRPTNNFNLTGEKIEVIDLEIRDKKSIDNLVSQINKKGKIDFFTSMIAEIPAVNKFEKMPFENFKKDQEMVLNQIYLLQQLIPYFNNNSNIILILSEIIFNKRLNYTSSYLISKYTLLGLMKALANEIQPDRIRINAVSPGMMATRFTAQLPLFVKESYQKKYGLIKPEEVAEEIFRIIEDNSIKGENIPVFKGEN